MSKIKIPVVYANLFQYATKENLENYVSKEEAENYVKKDEIESLIPSGSGDSYLVDFMVKNDMRYQFISCRKLEPYKTYNITISDGSAIDINTTVTATVQTPPNCGNCTSICLQYTHPMGDVLELWLYNSYNKLTLQNANYDGSNIYIGIKEVEV